MRAAAVAIALLLLACAACNRDETPKMTESTPSQSSTAAGSPQSSPPANALDPAVPPEKDERASSPTPSSPTQEVHLIEYEIHMPATLAPGRLGFNVENGGKEDHGFEIEGNGLHQKTEVLKRGDTTALEVDLKPGTYTVWCPVKDHAKRGMKTTITVK